MAATGKLLHRNRRPLALAGVALPSSAMVMLVFLFFLPAVMVAAERRDWCVCLCTDGCSLMLCLCKKRVALSGPEGRNWNKNLTSLHVLVALLFTIYLVIE